MKNIFFKKKNKNTLLKLTAGFTFIETIIAIAVFSIVITIGIGSLLNAYKTYNKTKDMRSIMDSLNFVMEDMSKSIRTGSEYKCENNVVCTQGRDLTFKDQYGNDISYTITENISKFEGGNTTDLIDPTKIKIDSSSGFNLAGGSTTDFIQPFVSIILSGSISLKGNVTPFYLQTSVSQRLLDSEKNGVVVIGGTNGMLPFGTNICSSEGEECMYDSKGIVYYGSDSSFYASVKVSDKGSITCSPNNFNVGKEIPSASCYFQPFGSSHESFPECAKEGEECTNKSSDSGTMFYSNGNFSFISSIGPDEKATCDSRAFAEGLPIDGAACFLELNNISYGVPVSCPVESPKSCSAIDEDCAYDADSIIYLGTGDSSMDFCRSVSGKGTMPCSFSVFGDPFLGTGKADGCYFFRN